MNLLFCRDCGGPHGTQDCTWSPVLVAHNAEVCNDCGCDVPFADTTPTDRRDGTVLRDGCYDKWEIAAEAREYHRSMER